MDPTWILVVVFVIVMGITLWLGWRDDKRKREKHALDVEMRHQERELLRQRDWSHFTFKVGNREYTVYREES